MMEYGKRIEERLTSGIVEKVPECKENKKENDVHYQLHDGVIRKDRVTARLGWYMMIQQQRIPDNIR